MTTKEEKAQPDVKEPKKEKAATEPKTEKAPKVRIVKFRSAVMLGGMNVESTTDRNMVGLEKELLGTAFVKFTLKSRTTLVPLSNVAYLELE